MATPSAPMSGKALKEALLRRHPWYDQMILTPEEWPLMRAVNGRFTDLAVRQQFLRSGKFENSDHYQVRTQLSQFLGKTEGIASSFGGAVFARQPEVRYAPEKNGDADADADADASSGLATDLETWSENVDGMGSSITELIETNSDESIPMGLVGFYITKPPLTSEQEASLAAITTEVRSPDGAIPADLAKKHGIVIMPRVVKMPVESITNWEEDDQGRPLWVLLTRHITRQLSPDADRKSVIEWILLDRENANVFEAEVADRVVSTTAAAEGGGTLPLNEAKVTFPLADTMIGDPELVRTVRHGLGMVPFAINYGGGRRYGLLQSRSLLNGSRRADLAQFNIESWFMFALYLHGVPLLALKTDRDINEVVREISRAVVLKASANEEIDYKSTPSEGFTTFMEAIEAKGLDAFRQAGADSGGMFEGGSTQPESGRAKAIRFKNTESRSLARISKDAADCHHDILEIAARYMLPKPPSIDVPAFQGSVRYASRFDLADVAELIEQYTTIGPHLKSLTWHSDMLTRIALLISGDIAREQAAKIADEIKTLTVQPPSPTVVQDPQDPNGATIDDEEIVAASGPTPRRKA